MLNLRKIVARKVGTLHPIKATPLLITQESRPKLSRHRIKRMPTVRPRPESWHPIGPVLRVAGRGSGRRDEAWFLLQSLKTKNNQTHQDVPGLTKVRRMLAHFCGAVRGMVARLVETRPGMILDGITHASRQKKNGKSPAVSHDSLVLVMLLHRMVLRLGVCENLFL